MTHFYLALFFFVWGYCEVTAVSSYYKESSKNIFEDENSLVPLFKFEKKSYYVGTLEKLTYLQAHQFCKDIRMNLATVHSTEELNALGDYVQKISKESDFWSSGSRLLDGKNWIWMSNLEIVEYTNWKQGEPNNKHNNEKCITFIVNKKKLLFNDDNCDRKLPFICEKVSSRPQEVYGEDNSRQSSLFQNPYVSPNINLLHHKGKSYYIGNLFEATFLEAIQYCQLIHMHLVSINSKEENDILYKYIRNTLAGRLFWSSGSRVIDDKTWIWMSSGKKVEYTAWAFNQPYNSAKKERCIQLVHEKNDGLFWNDLSCDTKVNFICESYGNYSYYGSEVAIQTSKPSDSENVCRIGAAHYQEGPLLQGTVVDGITYRFSKIKADHIKASRICRQHEMELISIPNMKTSSAITKLISQIQADGRFWTSGEKQSDGKWIWWNLQPLTYTNWAPKEPDGKEQFCIQLNDDGKWRDQYCDVERYFICEGSNSTRSDFLKCGLQPIVNMLID